MKRPTKPPTQPPQSPLSRPDTTMAQNEKNRANHLKSVEVWLLVALLILTLGAAFYEMGLGVIGLFIGIVLVLRLLTMTGRGDSRWGL
jgi:hypothetical protein